MSCPHGNPIGYCDICDEVDAAFEAGKRSALAEQPAQQEPVHQFRKRGCSDWYDGHPDHTDGGGPYEARTLYTSQLARHGWTTEQIAGMARLKEAQDKKLSQRKWVGPAEQEALDKKAENARELGLDYEPAQQEFVLPGGGYVPAIPAQQRPIKTFHGGKAWPVQKPAQQCKWPTCQSEEYQQALAQEIEHELVGEQPAPVQQEPIYQYQMANGSWIDQTKESHDYNVRHGQATVRVVYTSQPAQQEPVATITITQRGPIRIIDNNFDDCVRGWPDGEYNLYTSPQPAQRTWVGLTDKEIDKTYETKVWDARRSYARAIEAKLKAKNFA